MPTMLYQIWKFSVFFKNVEDQYRFIRKKVALERDCWCFPSRHHLYNHQGVWKKKKKKIFFFAPKKCDFIDNHIYSTKAVQHKGMSVLCCHRKAYFKSLLHNYFIMKKKTTVKWSVILLTKEHGWPSSYD